MQRSLVELYSLDSSVTYQHGFVFLRQLTVHLRTAMLNKKPVESHRPSRHKRRRSFRLGTHSKRLQLAIHPCAVLVDECRRCSVQRQGKVNSSIDSSVD